MSDTKRTRSQQPIFFIHIPKTGGNTVISHFLAFMSPSEVFPTPPQLTLLENDLSTARNRLSKLKFLHGHIGSSLDGIFPLNAMRIITFIRHPVKLVASHYLSFRYMAELPMHEAAKALDIAEFLRVYPAFGTNPQARYLATVMGLKSPNTGLTDELTNAVARFDFIGVTERMDESLTALSEHYGVPRFQLTAQNESRASRDEIESVQAVLRRDEFLMRLDADFALRRRAEQRLDAWHDRTRTARLSASLVAGLDGKAPMPWVVAREKDTAITFVDGWHPQEWIGEPSEETQYWWASGRARLLLVSSTTQTIVVSLQVIETIGFDASAITVTVGSSKIPVEVKAANPGFEVTLQIDGNLLQKNDKALVIQLVGARSSTFADINPMIPDYRWRSFAVRKIKIASGVG